MPNIHIYELEPSKIIPGTTLPTFRNSVSFGRPFSFGNKTMQISYSRDYEPNSPLLSVKLSQDQMASYFYWVDDGVKNYYIDKFVILLLFIRFFYSKNETIEQTITGIIRDYIDSYSREEASIIRQNINDFITKMDWVLNSESTEIIPHISFSAVKKRSVIKNNS